MGSASRHVLDGMIDRIVEPYSGFGNGMESSRRRVRLEGDFYFIPGMIFSDICLTILNSSVMEWLENVSKTNKLQVSKSMILGFVASLACRLLCGGVPSLGVDYRVLGDVYDSVCGMGTNHYVVVDRTGGRVLFVSGGEALCG